MPRPGPETAGATDGAPGPRPPAWDLPGRAAATGILVLTVTTASGLLGPRWTGLLAPFPIALSVVAAFVRAQQGPAAVARTLAGAVLSLVSFSAFCLTAALLLRPAGGAAFLLAAGAAVAIQLLAVTVRHRAAMPGKAQAEKTRSG